MVLSMEIIKIMDIVNNKNEIVGVIQQEKYSTITANRVFGRMYIHQRLTR